MVHDLSHNYYIAVLICAKKLKDFLFLYCFFGVIFLSK